MHPSHLHTGALAERVPGLLGEHSSAAPMSGSMPAFSYHMACVMVTAQCMQTQILQEHLSMPW